MTVLGLLLSWLRTPCWLVSVMSDVFLVGFDARVSEIQDRLRLCQPILTFGDDERMYLARRLDWSYLDEVTDGSLTLVDDDDVATFGTLVPSEPRVPIESGIGVLIVGGAFFDAVRTLGHDPWGDVTLHRLEGNSGWMGLADVSQLDLIKARLARKAARSVDEELAKAVASKANVSSRGKSASRILRKCGRRRTDVAIRELAIALVDGELDLFRRRVARYSVELEETRDALEERARRHIRLAERSVPLEALVSKMHADVTTSGEQLLVYGKALVCLRFGVSTLAAPELSTIEPPPRKPPLAFARRVWERRDVNVGSDFYQIASSQSHEVEVLPDKAPSELRLRAPESWDGLREKLESRAW